MDMPDWAIAASVADLNQWFQLARSLVLLIIAARRIGPRRLQFPHAERSLMIASLAVSLILAASAVAPRNIILMVADGAGFAHFAAAGSDYATWPVRLAMSTVPDGGTYDPERAWSDSAWCVRNVTDSAAAITALTTGVKTTNGRLAVDPRGDRLAPLAETMAAAGKATGVVTTVPFDHATPAGFAVSHADRDDYAEIARLMLVDGSLDVIMGAGHPWYDDSGRKRGDPRYTYVGDAATWDDLAAGRLGWTLITTRAQFLALAEGPTPSRVVGVPPAYETLQEQRVGDPLADAFVVPRDENEPTLAEMARAALNVVDDDPDGFCLLIEGGAVDWASHHRRYGRMVEEMTEFNEAVATVVDWLTAHGRLDETLLVVTADHESGYLVGRTFLTGDHTNALVPLYARGTGSEELIPRADQTDPVRGSYLENSELGQVLSGIGRRRGRP
jgi:alkaline phosphatase